MKTLYLECAMGAAGDMLTAALLELWPDREGFLRQLNAAGIPGVLVACAPAVKCGIGGSHLTVRVNGQEERSADVDGHCHAHDGDHDHHHGDAHTPHDGEPDHCHGDEHGHHHHQHHHHQSYADICGLIAGLALPEAVREDAQAVYRLIAEAESEVHGVSMDQIHFHEVGTMDAVADVTGFCLLLHLLRPEQVIASPVHVGGGFVRCAHGVLPVPAPATALLLQGIPSYGGSIQGELCTPTGAALLKYFVTRFGDRPVMTVEKIGYGMGQKDFEAANCVRAFWGETEGVLAAGDEGTDEIVEVVCNLDDMTAEAIGYACKLLLQRGALDVSTTAIGMKKGRPAVQLSVLCAPERGREFGKLLLTHTTTIGVRMRRWERMVLRSEQAEVQTDYGPLRVKVSKGYGITRYKPEFEDVRRIAEQSGSPFDEIATKAYEAVRE